MLNDVTIGYIPDRPEISQEAARALLEALKALMKEIVTVYGYGPLRFDSYLQACAAIAEAEKLPKVRDFKKAP